MPPTTSADGVSFYDPKSGSVLQTSKANAALLKDAGYKTGQDAEQAYNNSSVAATGIATLLGAAHGATFGASTWAENNLTSDTFRATLKGIEDAHPYAYGAGEFGGALAGFGKIGALAKGAEATFLAGKAGGLATAGLKLTEAEKAIERAGEVRAIGTRLIGAAAAGGMDAVDAAQTRGDPWTGEQVAHGLGLGLAMGAFGEAVGASLHHLVTPFQKANAWALNKARNSKWYSWTEEAIKPEIQQTERSIGPNAAFDAAGYGRDISETPRIPDPVTGRAETNVTTERPVSAADQSKINRHSYDTAKYAFDQSQRNSLDDQLSKSLTHLSPEDVELQTRLSNDEANVKINENIKKLDIAGGQGFRRTVQLSDEELAKRVDLFRKYDPTISSKRLANKITSTNNIPYEELHVYAQPEFKWPREFLPDGTENPEYNVPKSQTKFAKTPQGIAHQIQQRIKPTVAEDLQSGAVKEAFAQADPETGAITAANQEDYGLPQNSDVERAPREREHVQFGPADDLALSKLAQRGPPADPQFPAPGVDKFIAEGGYNDGGSLPKGDTVADPFQGSRLDSGLRTGVNRPQRSARQVYEEMMSGEYGHLISPEQRQQLLKYQEDRAVYNVAKKQHGKDSREFEGKLREWMTTGKFGPSPLAPVRPIEPIKPELAFAHEANLPAEVKNGLSNLGFKVRINEPQMYPGLGVGASQGVAAGIPGKAMKGGHIGTPPPGINAPYLGTKLKYSATDNNPLERWSNNLFTLASLGTGGNLLSSLAGYSIPHAYLGSSGLAGAGFALRAINRTVIGALEKEGISNSLFSRFLRTANHNAGRLIRETTQAAIPVAENLFFGGENTEQSYHAIGESLDRMTGNPSAVADYLHETYAPAIGIDPKAAANVIGVQANAINYLAQARPKDPSPQALIKQKYTPPRSEQVKFLNVYRALNDPYGSLTDPNLDAVKAIEQVYPETMKKVREMVVSVLLDNPNIQLGPNQAKRVSVLLGIPATVGMDPGYIDRLQKLAVAANMPQAGQAKATPMRGGNRRVKVNSNSADTLAAPSQQNAVENA